MATAGISLVRDNTERLRPPRFMWVPFELGRPFGAPDEPEFQTRVLRDVLALFEHEGPSPALENFPDDAPGGEMDMTGWTCPIALPSVAEMEIPEFLGAVLAEIDGLAPWHQVAIENRGRTATGVLGIPIKETASFLFEVLENVPESPNQNISVGDAFRQSCEELKTYYLEAATAKPGATSSRELADWFWGETAAGRLLLALHPASLRSADEGIKRVAETQLVPRLQKHRLG
ncbi:MAG: hypothetical protein HOK54_11590 [Alphaproteobacteria bacterium]|nr:hypothetical protein [Alphaproteobacteria bacterium]